MQQRALFKKLEATRAYKRARNPCKVVAVTCLRPYAFNLGKWLRWLWLCRGPRKDRRMMSSGGQVRRAADSKHKARLGEWADVLGR